MSEHYVYTLAYPDGHVFYVGKGMGKRIDDHEREARVANKRGRNPHKEEIIREIWREGEKVVKTKLAFFKIHEEACMYEIALIFFMDGLTNLTGGGDGIHRVPSMERLEEPVRTFLASHPNASISDIARAIGRGRSMAHKVLSVVREQQASGIPPIPLVEQVQAILEATPEASIRDIAQAIGRSKTTAHKAVKAVKQQRG